VFLHLSYPRFFWLLVGIAMAWARCRWRSPRPTADPARRACSPSRRLEVRPCAVAQMIDRVHVSGGAERLQRTFAEAIDPREVALTVITLREGCPSRRPSCAIAACGSCASPRSASPIPARARAGRLRARRALPTLLHAFHAILCVHGLRRDVLEAYRD
jgi:hypothetical protein